jgi:hypothetical protein
MLSVIGLCPVNINILAPKIPALEMGSKIQNGNFPLKALKIAIKFQSFTETISKNTVV